jgi:hypothetical protein
MGDRRRSRDPGYYEPFLPDMLLPKHEENLSGSRESLSL